MSTNWRTIHLGDHVDLVAGFPFKSAHYLDTPSDGIRLLRGDNVAQGWLRWEGAKYWPEHDRSEYEGYALREGDVILAMDRPWIEAGLKYAWARRSDLSCLLVQRVARMRGVNGLATHYLRYVIGSSEFTAHVKSITTGVNVPHISAKDIKRFQFRLPSPAEQERTASILGAYDDLIEVNRQRIVLMEEIAQRLFDEWFVRPSADLEGSQRTLLPGWEDVPLESLCERITDGAHHSPPSMPTGSMMASVKDMRDWDFDLTDCRRISEEDFSALVRSGCRPAVGDILIAKDGANLNKHTFLVWEDRPIVLLSSIAILRPRAGMEREFLVAMLKSERMSAAIKRMRSGAAIPRIILRDFKRLPVALPPAPLRQKFEKVAGPIHGMCRRLARTNANLAAQRDCLLPQLISGELPASATERELEAAA